MDVIYAASTNDPAWSFGSAPPRSRSRTRRLKIASALPAAKLLIHELAGYRVKVSEDGKDSYGNGKEPANDGLVLELAIGVYTAARPRRRMGITHIGLEPPVATGSLLSPTAIALIPSSGEDPWNRCDRGDPWTQPSLGNGRPGPQIVLKTSVTDDNQRDDRQ